MTLFPRVDSPMLGAVSQLQVFNAIVVFHAIDVVDDFVGPQFSAKMFGHDGAMLKLVAVVRMADQNVPMPVVHATASPSGRLNAEAALPPSVTLTEAPGAAEFLPDATTASHAGLEILAAFRAGSWGQAIGRRLGSADARQPVALGGTEAGRFVVPSNLTRKGDTALGAGVIDHPSKLADQVQLCH